MLCRPAQAEANAGPVALALVVMDDLQRFPFARARRIDIDPEQKMTDLAVELLREIAPFLPFQGEELLF